MGIPKFFRFLQESYPDIVSPNLVKKVASLWVDANAKIYTACDNVYGFNDRNPEEALRKNQIAQNPDNKQQTYENCIRETIDVLKNLIKKVEPEEVLGIMFDGLIPLAKIYQTRERRYRGALPKQEISEETEEDYENVPTGEGKGDVKQNKYGWKQKMKDYSRIMITPGTTFMYDIDAFLSEWIMKDDPSFPPQKVYSSYKSDSHGEGEHKIFDYLKKYYGKDGKFDSIESDDMKYHVIHGLDADLILLSLLSDIEGIILMRHDYGNYVMIDRLRSHILRDMVVDGKQVSSKILISDFCCIMALIGNDFLKAHIMCSKMENAIPMLIEAYHKLNKQFTNEEGKIDFSVFEEYCNLLVEKEPVFVVEHLMDALKEIPLYRSFPAEMTIGEIRKELKIKLNSVEEMESKDDINKLENYITGNMSKIYKMFRDQYNKNAVVPYAYNVFDRLGVADIKEMIDVKNVSSSTIRNFCFKYLEGIQWNIVYYLFGHNQTRNNWGFNYHYSPLMIDLVEYMRSSNSHKTMKFNEIKVVEQKWHGIVSQTLCVIPKEKMDILPPALHKYYRDEQAGLLDQFPISYKVDYFNYKDNIHSRVLTNFPDIETIVDLVEKNPITKNTGIYQLKPDYESRVSNLKLAIENRIKNISMVRQRTFYEKKILSQQERMKQKEEKTPFVMRGMSSRGRGGFSTRGRGRGK